MARPAPRVAAKLAEDPTAIECAAALGVTLRTVRTYIAQGRLEAYRIGPKLIRVRAESLEALLQPLSVRKGAA